VFNVGGGEILVLLLIALIFLGPDKMPDAARKVGKMLGEVRRMTSGFQEEVRSAMDLDGSATAASSVDASPPRLEEPPAVPEPASVDPAADQPLRPAATPETPEIPEAAERPSGEPGRGDTSAA
jgi:Tat protein translocase TatB subunit